MLSHLMSSRYLNVLKVKTWLPQKQKELSKWNKKHFSLFLKSSLIDIQNKPVKMKWTQPLKMTRFDEWKPFTIWNLKRFSKHFTSRWSSCVINKKWFNIAEVYGFLSKSFSFIYFNRCSYNNWNFSRRLFSFNCHRFLPITGC